MSDKGNTKRPQSACSRYRSYGIGLLLLFGGVLVIECVGLTELLRFVALIMSVAKVSKFFRQHLRSLNLVNVLHVAAATLLVVWFWTVLPPFAALKALGATFVVVVTIKRDAKRARRGSKAITWRLLLRLLCLSMAAICLPEQSIATDRIRLLASLLLLTESSVMKTGRYVDNYLKIFPLYARQWVILVVGIIVAGLILIGVQYLSLDSIGIAGTLLVISRQIKRQLKRVQAET